MSKILLIELAFLPPSSPVPLSSSQKGTQQDQETLANSIWVVKNVELGETGDFPLASQSAFLIAQVLLDPT